MSRSYEEFIIDNTPSKTYCINNINFYLNAKSIPKRDVVLMDHFKCQCCASRTKKLCYLIGENGPAYLSNLKGKYDGDKNGKIYKIREKIENNLKNLSFLDVYVVKQDSLPPVDEGYDIYTKQPFKHFTIYPDKYTSNDLADKVIPLLKKYLPIISSRLSKLTLPESIESTKIIYDELIKEN